VLSLLLCGLSTYTLYMLQNSKKDVVQIKENHLHELPEAVELVRKIAANTEEIKKSLEAAERTERTILALDSYLRARLNGGGRDYGHSDSR
jgi:formylmethanofuran dehydrogenase subunit E